jgi:hypothetical protein
LWVRQGSQSNIIGLDIENNNTGQEIEIQIKGPTKTCGGKVGQSASGVWYTEANSEGCATTIAVKVFHFMLN